MESTTRPDEAAAPARRTPSYVHRHLSFGWIALGLFVLLGLALEVLHGLKAPMYLGVSSEPRRLMWTLAHAHGTLLALVNVALAATLHLMPPRSARAQAIASACLIGATILLPFGFFLGGAFTEASDPGVGVLLVPIGALLLIVAIALTARQALHAAADRAA
jgi:hypothetical protein